MIDRRGYVRKAPFLHLKPSKKKGKPSWKTNALSPPLVLRHSFAHPTMLHGLVDMLKFRWTIAKGRKKRIYFFNINFLVPSKTIYLGTAEKSSCASFPGKERKQGTHINFFGAISGSKKGAPNGPFWATKSLVCFFLPLIAYNFCRHISGDPAQILHKNQVFPLLIFLWVRKESRKISAKFPTKSPVRKIKKITDELLQERRFKEQCAINLNKFGGLSRHWVGGKILPFECFGGHSSWGRKNTNKNPQKFPGQSREIHVYVTNYVLFLRRFFAHKFLLLLHSTPCV